MDTKVILDIIQKDIHYKPSYGFLTGFDKDFYEAEIEIPKQLKRNIDKNVIYKNNCFICPECNSIVNNTDNFCRYCGQKIKFNK